MKIFLIFSIILIQLFLLCPALQAQEPVPSATPFDITLRPEQDIAAPIQIELSGGNLQADVSDEPGIQGSKSLPITSIRAIAHPYQYFFSEANGSHVLVLPLDVRFGIDGRSSKPYFESIQVPLLSVSADYDNQVFRINIAQYRHMGVAGYDSFGDTPINIDSIVPISLEHMTKTYNDGRIHLIYRLHVALPASIITVNNVGRLYNTAEKKYTPLLNPAQIPNKLTNRSHTSYYSICIGIDLKQWLSLKYTLLVEEYGSDRSDGYVEAARRNRVLNLDTRVDKILHRPGMGNLAAGVYFENWTQSAIAGPTISNDSVLLNYGNMKSFGLKLTWQPPHMKERRQVRMHTRGY